MQYCKRTKREKLIAILLTIAMVPTLVPSISFAGDFSDDQPAARAEQQAEKKSEPKAEKNEESGDEQKEEVKSEKASDSGDDSPDQKQKAEPEKDAEESTEATEATEAMEPGDEAAREDEAQRDEEKKDEEKEANEDKFPAQDFESSDDGVTVNVSAPEGTWMHVKSVSISAGDVEGAVGENVSGKINEDILYDPGAGAIPEGAVFRGWTTDEDYAAQTEALTIDDVRAEVADTDWDSVTDADEAGGTVLTYHAMLFKQYVITYIDDQGMTLGRSLVY